MAIVQITAITLAIQYFYQVLPKQLKTKKTARIQSIAAGIFPMFFFLSFNRGTWKYHLQLKKNEWFKHYLKWFYCLIVFFPSLFLFSSRLQILAKLFKYFGYKSGNSAIWSDLYPFAITHTNTYIIENFMMKWNEKKRGAQEQIQSLNPLLCWPMGM